MQDKMNNLTEEVKKWRMLYRLSSHGQSYSNSEALIETLGKKLLNELDGDGFYWHWVEEKENVKKYTASRNWTFKKPLAHKQLISEIDSSKNQIIQSFFEQHFNTAKCVFFPLVEEFNPYKGVLLIPIGSEGKITAIGQFYFLESQVSLTEQTLEGWELFRTEMNRQLDFCLVHERERDQVVQLAQASRLSSLGAMAGGIAHEINNPVTIIMGMLKLVIKELASDKPLDREKMGGTLEKARQYTERISKIVKGIRALSRDGSRDPFIQSKVQDIIDNTFGLCEASIQTNSIQLSYDLEDPNMSLDCRPVQISQVLLNLINNSLDAIGDRKNPWIHVAVKKINDEIVEFSVTDCGEGIPADIAFQLMQPFFTTKGAGKGTGLGLSISQEIIKAHSGKLTLDREFPNTRFYFQIPIDQSKIEHKAS